MKLPEPNGGGEFTPPPSGTHVAICYRFIDLGTQRTEYKGEVKEQHKVLISWELPHEMMDTEDGEKPFTIHKRYTWSMHEKANLRHDLESWRGKRFTEADFGEGGFDTQNLIGVPCMVSVVHNEKDGKTYANLSGISGLPKGMDKPTLTNDRAYLVLDPESFEPSIFETLSDGLQETIRKSPEYQAINGGPKKEQGVEMPEGDRRNVDFDLDDEIPF